MSRNDEITRNLRTESIDWVKMPAKYHKLLNTALELFDAIELWATNIEEKLNALDVPIGEESRYLTRFSGEKLWSNRNKNYEYLV